MNINWSEKSPKDFCALGARVLNIKKCPNLLECIISIGLNLIGNREDEPYNPGEAL